MTREGLSLPALTPDMSHLARVPITSKSNATAMVGTADTTYATETAAFPRYWRNITVDTPLTPDTKSSSMSSTASHIKAPILSTIRSSASESDASSRSVPTKQGHTPSTFLRSILKRPSTQLTTPKPARKVSFNEREIIQDAIDLNTKRYEQQVAIVQRATAAAMEARINLGRFKERLAEMDAEEEKIRAEKQTKTEKAALKKAKKEWKAALEKEEKEQRQDDREKEVQAWWFTRDARRQKWLEKGREYHYFYNDPDI